VNIKVKQIYEHFCQEYSNTDRGKNQCDCCVFRAYRRDTTSQRAEGSQVFPVLTCKTSACSFVRICAVRYTENPPTDTYPRYRQSIPVCHPNNVVYLKASRSISKQYFHDSHIETYRINKWPLACNSNLHEIKFEISFIARQYRLSWRLSSFQKELTLMQ